MSGTRLIKYFRGPSFTAADWTTRNPFLKSGEIGYELNTGIVVAAKVGPGYWNDLNYFGLDVYPYSEEVTNIIGDAEGNLQGMTVIEILKLMLSPYEIPVFSSVRNNGGGTYQETTIREIGQSIAGSVNVIYNITNPLNLSGATPIQLTAGGTFSNEGYFANSGNIQLTLASPLAPTAPLTVTIQIKATHTEGQTNNSSDKTEIIFKPRIMWVSSNSDSCPDGTTFMSFTGQQNILSSDYKLDYTFAGSGYSWIAIPAMLNPTNIIFTDVTNPIALADYAMQSMGTISINNGVGTYNYVLYRSVYKLILATKLNIS